MTLVDSSAWIEFFRRTESPADRSLDRLIRASGELATTEPILMELLAGAMSRAQRSQVRRALSGCRMLRIYGPADWDDAAAIYLACRQAGGTPRQLIDCLIAAVAMRAGVPVLAQDRDYELIARHTDLELAG